MNVPKGFKKICSWLMVEIEEDIPKDQDMIAFAIEQLDDYEREEAKQFLNYVLSQKTSDKELIDIWFHSGARLGFVDEAHYRPVLEEIRRRLAGDAPSFRL
jgi:formate dehydrogenase maturation protein FdhE